MKELPDLNQLFCLKLVTAMRTRPPIYLNISIFMCRSFSDLVAVLHYCILQIGVLKIPFCIRNAPGGVFKNLRNIWFSRIFRRMVSVLIRSPFRNKTLQLVNVDFPITNTGSVITMCHTPWSRLLAQWCHKNDFGLIITNSKWNQRTNSIRRTGKGIKELRYLIRYLRSGGRIIIMADVFNNLKNCSARFLERDCNVSLLPARLAKIAEVPLIAAIPELRNDTIHIYNGPGFDPKRTNPDPSGIMQIFMAFFEKEIRRNPSIWAGFVRESLSKYRVA
jgi:Bacterial lipid A biosynthesis acyltransferase